MHLSEPYAWHSLLAAGIVPVVVHGYMQFAAIAGGIITISYKVGKIVR